MKPKIIGTGLSGLVGSRIVEMLGSKYDFVDFSLDTHVDITNVDQLSQAFKQNAVALVVLHLAAFTDTAAAWQQRGDKDGLCYRLNVLGTKNIVQLCSQMNKYLVHFSTDFVFDGAKASPYTETDTPSPIEWYGQTKYWAEQEILSGSQSAAIVRIATPFRAKFEPKKDLIRRIIDALANHTLYPMFTDQITTPTFIDDIAQSIDLFINQQPSGIFHLVGSSYQSAYDLAVLIAQTFGFNTQEIKPGSLKKYVESQPVGSRPWQQNLALSNAKITQLGAILRTTRQALLDMKAQMV